jgi:hypothetical protein
VEIVEQNFLVAVRKEQQQMEKVLAQIVLTKHNLQLKKQKIQKLLQLMYGVQTDTKIYGIRI